MDNRKRIAFLTVTFILLYGAASFLSLSILAEDPLNYPDLPIYQERTTSILNGGIPYRDIEMESPPLIVYLMVPAQLIGGGLLHYALWFSVMTFIGALAVYILLRRIDEDGAFLASLLYLIHPASVCTASVNVQDESLIAVLIVVSLSALAIGMWRAALSLSFIGVAAKAFTVFLIPYILTADRDPSRTRKGLFLLIALGALLIAPFLILIPEQFLAFPDYYLSQTMGGGVSDGMSLWRHLADLGIILPASFFIITLSTSYLLILYLIRRFEPGHFAAGYLVLLPFLLFFPKIYPYYFIMALAPLCVLAVKNRNVFCYSVLIYLGSAATMSFVTIGNEPSMSGVWLWMPVIINLLLSALMIWTAAKVIKEDGLWSGMKGAKAS